MELDYSSEILDDLIAICDLLGVQYDMSGIDSYCEAISYLICQIKKFIGG